MQLTDDRTFLNDIDQIRDKVFRITKRILISQEEAEDATQEVIVKLWQMDAAKRNGFRSIEAYSVTMAKNYCLDRLKSVQFLSAKNQTFCYCQSFHLKIGFAFV